MLQHKCYTAEIILKSFPFCFFSKLLILISLLSFEPSHLLIFTDTALWTRSCPLPSPLSLIYGFMSRKHLVTVMKGAEVAGGTMREFDTFSQVFQQC